MTQFILQDEIFYHGTRAKFERFRPLSHFGSIEAADAILDSNPAIKPEKLNGMEDIKKQHQFIAHTLVTPDRITIPVRLNLTNTYEVQDIAACHDLDTYKSFTVHHIAHDLKLNFIPNFFEYIFSEPFKMESSEIIHELTQDTLYTPASDTENMYHLSLQRMIHYFESIGYDGFHYLNQYEDPGHISYIVFRPENIIRQDMSNVSTTYKHQPRRKIPQLFPAHKTTPEYTKTLDLEESHHYQIFKQKLYRHKNQVNPEHADKYKVHYAQIFYTEILPKIKKISRQSEFGYHGLSHTEQTVMYGLDIAITCACDPMPVILACALHDICRKNNDCDNTHAGQAVPFVRKFLSENCPTMSRGTVEEIVNAVKNHSDNKTAKNLTEACLWDADRIRLAWDGIYRPEYFSTQYGKYIADLPPMAQEAYIKRQNQILINSKIKTAEQIKHEYECNKVAVMQEFKIKSKGF